jgi:hypothetical protein
MESVDFERRVRELESFKGEAELYRRELGILMENMAHDARKAR